MIAHVVGINIPLLVLPMVAVISLFLAYQSLHRKASPPGQELLLITSIYSFPLLFFLAVFIFVYLVKVLTPLDWVMLSVYYWLPNYPGLAHLFIAAVLLVLAWKYQASSARAKTLLIIYTVVWMVFVAHVVWWYVTKQQFVYL
jgi:hypothetical protein